MSDLIRRSELYKRGCKVTEYDEAGYSIEYMAVSFKDIRNAQTVEARVHGEWEQYPTSLHRRCSVCKKEYDKLTNQFVGNFCPNCGAKMKVVE